MTILGSVLDEDLTMGSTSPPLGLSALSNTAPMLSSGGTCGFILVDPRAADPSICGGIMHSTESPGENLDQEK